MELYVAKELKDKIEPIEETLALYKKEYEDLQAKMSQNFQHIEKVDVHYNGVVKAMLTNKGIMLKEINEFNILKEFQRINKKEDQAKSRIKRQQSSISPSNRDVSPRGDGKDKQTHYVNKLSLVA